MKSLNLGVTNELEALPVVQAVSTAFIRTVGNNDHLAGQIELVLEEIFINIIKDAYLPGQQERIELTFGLEESLLEITIRFKGIPFDIDYLRQCEQNSIVDTIDDSGQWIGLALIRRFTDQVHYRNLGRDGQEIRMLWRLSTQESPSAQAMADEETDRPTVSPTQICIRSMAPAEAAIVSKLAYFTYNYSYNYGYIYDPERVRSLNDQGLMISGVAVHKDQGIIGHSALAPDHHSDLFEMCNGFVDPRYRGGGCLNMFADYGISEAQRLGAGGIFVTAVTTHPYSQKAAIKKDLRESALLVSRVQPLAMRSIRDQAVARESVFFMARLFSHRAKGSYYVPTQHRAMLERICRYINVEAGFEDGPADIVLPEYGQLEYKVDDYQAGHIFILSYGMDTIDQIATILRRWQLDRLETIYLSLPLVQPATVSRCESFEAMGFFFSGFRYGRDGKDWLVLQYLNNQRYNYGLIKAATSFGQELIDYVRDHDPVSRL
ncbi:MAG: ATP-binding protein [Candidatus Delongbacteria bacterium]|nr:ATP-binding protein [Candidatus Delongbacteria bacterium]